MAVLESIISPRDGRGGKRTALTEEEIADLKIRPGTFWNVYSFGICLIFTNIFIAWSAGLANGYWDFLISLIFISTAFVCLHLCIAEMVSVLPFSGIPVQDFNFFINSILTGGTYGFARVTVGPFAGFLVGCCESIANIVYTLIGVMPIGTTITYIFDADPKYEPMYWVFTYIAIIAVEFMGRKLYFHFLNTYAFGLVMILVFYLILSFQSVDTERYIPTTKHNVLENGIEGFLGLSPVVGWFYIGLETMPLISDEIRDVRALIFTSVCKFLILFFRRKLILREESSRR